MTFKELKDREGLDKIIKIIKEERKRLLKKIIMNISETFRVIEGEKNDNRRAIEKND